MLVNRRVVADLDAHVENLVDLVHENAFGQAERGDVGAHQAAGPVVLFEHDDFIAEGHQVVGDGERGRARADTGDALSVFLAGDLGKAVRDVVAQIGRDALEAADGDGLAIHAATAAGGLARTIASAAENRGKYIRLPVEHVGVGIAALRDQADVFGNVGVGRTGPLAVHNFVEVVRIVDVRGVHTWILSISTTVNLRLRWRRANQYGFIVHPGAGWGWGCCIEGNDRRPAHSAGAWKRPRAGQNPTLMVKPAYLDSNAAFTAASTFGASCRRISTRVLSKAGTSNC